MRFRAFRLLVPLVKNMDPIKPSGTTGSSPISPQIKTPQQSEPSGQPPPNLPIREEKNFPLNPPPPMPPQSTDTRKPQMEPKPASYTPTIPSPGAPGTSLPKTPPSTTPPPPPVSPGGAPPVFKSSIRTMEEDIAAIKKGQPPVGVQIEKQSERDVKPQAPTAPPAPKITPPPKPIAEVRLGEPEKAKPLPGTAPFGAPPLSPKPVSPPAPPSGKPSLAIPPTSKFNKKILIFVAGGLVVVVFLVWFFALRTPSAPEVVLSPTPTYPITPSITPAPTPTPIESYFSIVSSVSVQLGPNFTSRFDNSIDKTLLKTSAGEPALYSIYNPTSGEKYTLSEFLGGLLIVPPAELTSAIYDNSLYLTAIYKSDGKDGFGFIARVKEPTAALAVLGSWEKTVTQDIKDLLGFNPAKAASTTFLDNTYQGVAIRYRNFPDPNLTIDYAIVRARNGENYLVFTNSREHIYAIIDKLK